MVFIAQFERECQVGYLRVRFISKRLRFSNPNHIIVSVIQLSFGERIRFSNCALLLGYACR